MTKSNIEVSREIWSTHLSGLVVGAGTPGQTQSLQFTYLQCGLYYHVLSGELQLTFADSGPLKKEVPAREMKRRGLTKDKKKVERRRRRKKSSHVHIFPLRLKPLHRVVFDVDTIQQTISVNENSEPSNVSTLELFQRE